MEISKYERDGKVAILFASNSGWFSQAWFTEHKNVFLVFDSKVVEWVLERDKLMETISYRSQKVSDINDQIIKYCDERYNVYVTDNQVWDLKVEWLEMGEKFRIVNLDGKETVELLYQTQWLEA